MNPLGEPTPLIKGNESSIGYERNGENHIPRSAEQIEEIVKQSASLNPGATEDVLNMIRKAVGNAPYIEGAWMDKHNGKYYLQYSSPGAE